MTVRPCLDCPAFVTDASRCPSCERKRQRARNASPRRRRLYGGSWARYSRARRQAQPFCSLCGSTERLSVDHDTNLVLCQTHNSERSWRNRGDS